MIPDCFIFDLDGVLADYDLEKRLDAMEQMTGIAAAEIRARLWDSGFEDEADAGAFPDGQSYLEAFNARLGYTLTREQWTRARAVSMTPFDDMLALTRRLAGMGTVAILTNNVPLFQDVLGEVLPEVIEIFGERIYFSCALKLAKPDPDIYRQTARLCGTVPERCIFTDDKPENATGSQQAGMTGVHFQSSQQYESALRAAGLALV